CHPTDGCQDGDGFGGADFQYLAANTIDKKTGEPILPAISIKMIRGVPVGFVGLTLEGTPGIVNPAGIKNVRFADEIVTANKWSTSVVTSAGTNGQLITDIDYSIDRRTRKFTEITAKNVVVENGIRNADGTWQTTAPGVYAKNPALVDPDAKRLADKYRTAV